MGNWEDTFEACMWSLGLSSLLPDFGEVRYRGKILRCATSEQWKPWTVDWIFWSHNPVKSFLSFKYVFSGIFVIVTKDLTLISTVFEMHVCTDSVHMAGSHFLRANISVHSTELAALTFKALENTCSQWITEEYSREPKAGRGVTHYTGLCGRDRKGPWRSRKSVIGSELQTFSQSFWWIPMSPYH